MFDELHTEVLQIFEVLNRVLLSEILSGDQKHHFLLLNDENEFLLRLSFNHVFGGLSLAVFEVVRGVEGIPRRPHQFDLPKVLHEIALCLFEAEPLKFSLIAVVEGVLQVGVVKLRVPFLRFEGKELVDLSIGQTQSQTLVLIQIEFAIHFQQLLFCGSVQRYHLLRSYLRILIDVGIAELPVIPGDLLHVFEFEKELFLVDLARMV